MFRVRNQVFPCRQVYQIPYGRMKMNITRSGMFLIDGRETSYGVSMFTSFG